MSLDDKIFGNYDDERENMIRVKHIKQSIKELKEKRHCAGLGCIECSKRMDELDKIFGKGLI